MRNGLGQFLSVLHLGRCALLSLARMAQVGGGGFEAMGKAVFGFGTDFLFTYVTPKQLRIESPPVAVAYLRPGHANSGHPVAISIDVGAGCRAVFKEAADSLD